MSDQICHEGYNVQCDEYVIGNYRYFTMISKVSHNPAGPFPDLLINKFNNGIKYLYKCRGQF